jgi:hypothetical protein
VAAALQLPQVVVLVYAGSALVAAALQLPHVADLQVELVQVPQPEPARAPAPKVSAAAAVSFILKIEIMCCSRSEKRVAQGIVVAG